ncbi:dihydroxy-acid and 6-phosphogluconate dehydratase [Hortaea werneckii]|nr:dihydroxy-acid and 6-phosphogluconate dehydratase [Hortaea werneckii]
MGFNMNVFRILADVSHTASKCILIYQIHHNKSAEGVSLLTQLLYILVFGTRYLDLFWVPPPMSWWNFVLKIFYITSSAYIVYLMMRRYARTREKEYGWKLATWTLGGSLVSAPFVTLLFEGWAGMRFSEILWTFSIILESVCILPQLLLLRQTSVPTVIDSFYLVTLGSYRFFYILNWLVRGIGEGYFDPISVIFGVIQTALYIDFAWVYWSRQRVKLRGGGVVDSDDLTKSFLVRRFIGKRGSTGSEDGEADEDAEALARQENGTIQDGGRSAGGRNWGARGISVSADDTLAEHERPGARRQESYSDAAQADAQPMADPASFEDDDDEADAPPPPAKDNSENKHKKENEDPVERSSTPADAVGSSAGPRTGEQQIHIAIEQDIQFQNLACACPPTMDPDNLQKQNRPESPRYLTFQNSKPGSGLNKFSSTLTREHDFPAAQAMLYAAGVKDEKTLKTFPQVGVASVWWEGNPCNTHLLDIGKEVKKNIEKDEMLAWQYNTIGVSDGITMGGDGMRFSLQTREIIADSIETVTCAQFHDACVTIPGCDKNMPGCVMGMARHNRPSIMIYGGTINPGYSNLLQKPINITTALEAHGAYLFDRLKNPADPSQTKDEILTDIEKTACPGQGACGGMFTANTMATAIETLGLSLPGSASTPATSPEKMRECGKVAKAIRVCMEKQILPKHCLTKRSFENALVMMMALGGSTNGVLHLLAMAVTADVELTLDDFQRISDKIPFIADLAPSGKHLMADLYEIGGVSSVHKLLIAAGLLDGSAITVTGKTLAENVEAWPSLKQGQEIIRSLDNPIKPTGHIEILYGNLAPKGAVAKITGKEGMSFTGKARVFNKEHELDQALNSGSIPRTENLVLVVRYEGPKGGPGMPEQLKASAAIMDAGLKNVALITDGRYSGASHGFIVGHICPEAAVGGPIAVVQDGDEITIDAASHTINMGVDAPELQRRLAEWQPPRRPVTRGVLAKYARLVGDASHGAVTDLF